MFEREHIVRIVLDNYKNRNRLQGHLDDAIFV